MSKGKIWLNKAAAPNSLALSVICLIAAFLMGGVPFFIFNSSFMIFLSCERDSVHMRNWIGCQEFHEMFNYVNLW